MRLRFPRTVAIAALISLLFTGSGLVAAQASDGTDQTSAEGPPTTNVGPAATARSRLSRRLEADDQFAPSEPAENPGAVGAMAIVADSPQRRADGAHAGGEAAAAAAAAQGVAVVEFQSQGDGRGASLVISDRAPKTAGASTANRAVVGTSYQPDAGGDDDSFELPEELPGYGAIYGGDITLGGGLGGWAGGWDGGPCSWDDGTYGYGSANLAGLALMSELHSCYRVWTRMEYLAWWADGQRLPPLVTTSDAGTPQDLVGVLGLDSTHVLFGNEKVGDDLRSGGRISVGAWLVDGGMEAVQADWLKLENGIERYTVSSTGVPSLARPFNNVNPANQPQVGNSDAAFVALDSYNDPGLGIFNLNLQGSVEIVAQSDLESAGALIRHMLWADCTERYWYRLYMLGGYRYFMLDERISISDRVFLVGPPFVLGTRLDSQDRFEAQNQFHGGDLGLLAEVHRGSLGVELMGKVAVGNMRQRLWTNGYSAVTVPGAPPVESDAGLLVQPSNTGLFIDDEIGIIPEFAINLMWQFTPQIKATLGYTFIYVNKVLRPGEMIDLTINPRQDLGGDLVPEITQFADRDFWVQGLNAGLEIRF